MKNLIAPYCALAALTALSSLAACTASTGEAPDVVDDTMQERRTLYLDEGGENPSPTPLPAPQNTPPSNYGHVSNCLGTGASGTATWFTNLAGNPVRLEACLPVHDAATNRFIYRASSTLSASGSVVSTGLAVVTPIAGSCTEDAHCGDNSPGTGYPYYCAPNSGGQFGCYKKLNVLNGVLNGGNGTTVSLSTRPNWTDVVSTMAVSSVGTIPVWNATTGTWQQRGGCGVVPYLNDRRFCLRVVTMAAMY